MSNTYKLKQPEHVTDGNLAESPAFHEEDRFDQVYALVRDPGIFATDPANTPEHMARVAKAARDIQAQLDVITKRRKFFLQMAEQAKKELEPFEDCLKHLIAINDGAIRDFIQDNAPKEKKSVILFDATIGKQSVSMDQRISLVDRDKTIEWCIRNYPEVVVRRKDMDWKTVKARMKTEPGFRPDGTSVEPPKENLYIKI